MSISNENNPSVAVINLGSLTADGSVPAVVTPKAMVIKSVSLLNGAAIAESDTDYALLSLKDSDDTVLATLDTRAAGQGAVAEFVAKAFALVAAQVANVAAGTSLKVVYDEEGTMALTNAQLVINWHAK